jgi:F-type H+-transporting ATPase subunit b
MRIDWTTLALQLVNFAILIALLQRFLYRPVLRMIDARRASVEAVRALAQRTDEETKARRAALEAEREAVAAERSAWLGAAAAQADAQARARRAEAERDASAVAQAARKELAEERERLLGELRLAALDLAVDLARRLVSELPQALRGEAWLERIAEHLKSLDPTERAALGSELEGSGALTVVTAWPLAPQSASAWRARLIEALGREVSVVFATDPALIAGAELHFAHATLKFGLRSVVEKLRRETNANGHGR